MGSIDSNTDWKVNEGFHFRASHLFCEDVNIKAIEGELETAFTENCSPFFVYSKAQILNNIHSYKNALERTTRDGNYILGYSIKANYNPHLLKLIKDAGCTGVTVSGREIQLAIQAGIEPTKIIFNGNGKTMWELELAARNDCLINVDSLFDLHHLVKVTEDLRCTARVLLRINPDVDSGVHPFLATGLAESKFGIGDEGLSECFDLLQSHPRIMLVGLHCHLGSTIVNTEIFQETMAMMMNMMEIVRKKGFSHLRYVNLGGGLGISSGPVNRTKVFTSLPADTKSELRNIITRYLKEADISTELTSCLDDEDSICGQLSVFEFTERVRVLLAKHPDIKLKYEQSIKSLIAFEGDIPSPEDLIHAISDQLAKTDLVLILEPGRSLIGNSAVLITKTSGCKNFKRNYLVVDGGMTEVIRPALYQGYHHIELAEPSKHPLTSKAVFDVVGPVCECADFLGKDRLLHCPHDGCTLSVFNVGAYCYSMSSNYNLRMRPSEVLVDGDKWQLIRRPDTMEDFMRPYQISSSK